MKRLKEVTAELLRLYRDREDSSDDENKVKLGERIKTLEWVLESGEKSKKK